MSEIKTPTIHYFAFDGNYGNADGIVLVRTDDWQEQDWTEIENATDSERASVAIEISRQYDDQPYPTPPPEAI